LEEQSQAIRKRRVMDAPLHRIETLLDLAASGDHVAISRLLTEQEGSLAQFVSGRLDKRLAARLDVGDIVQDILIDAARKLPLYLKDRPVPFPVWLQSLAIDHLKLNLRAHLRTQKRSVSREAPQVGINEASSNSSLMKNVRSRDKTPSSLMAGKELYAMVKKLMHELPEGDQELLRLRFAEQLPLKEIATQLGVSEPAVRMRQLRALRRLRELLNEDEE
jgi:RNA polymerase sigma-70 factor, ECF subfamily